MEALRAGRNAAHQCWPAYVHHMVLLAVAVVVAGFLELSWFFFNAQAVRSGVLQQYDLGGNERWMCLSQAILALCWK